jgi:hypothetical protein
MIDRSTVFILGAGASVPYGYPTGFQLRNDIIGSFPRELEGLLTKSGADTEVIRDSVSSATDMVAKFRDSMKPWVFGTALGLLQEQIAAVRGKLNVPKGTTPNLRIEDCDCKTLLLKYL